MYHIDENKNILVEMSARGGNNTISGYFRDSEVSNFNWQNRHMSDPSLHLLKDDTYTKLKFVRNPFTRVVSSYFKPFRKAEGGVSFLDFLTWLTSDNNVNNNVHWKPQWSAHDELYDYICKIEDTKNVKSIFLENFNTDISDVESIHITTKIPCEDGEYIHCKEWDERSWVPTSKVWEAKNRFVPAYNGFYNEETLTLIKKIYKQDIDAYGYQTPQIA